MFAGWRKHCSFMGIASGRSTFGGGIILYNFPGKTTVKKCTSTRQDVNTNINCFSTYVYNNKPEHATFPWWRTCKQVLAVCT